MSNIFAEIAQKATTFSALMVGREKITNDEIMTEYPNGVTVTNFDYCPGTDDNGESTEFPVLLFAEDTSKFFFGGMILKQITDAWLAHFDGDFDTCNAALQAGGGVKIRLHMENTRRPGADGRIHRIMKVDVL